MFIAVACSLVTIGVLMWLADHNIIGGVVQGVFSRLGLAIVIAALWVGIVALLY
jgi:hypothetical protein